MRILFTIIPEKGHINPYIPVAQALQKRGHTVAFHAAADIRDQLSKAGFSEFLGMEHAPEPPDQNRGRFFAEKINDKAWLRHWIKDLLIDKAPAQVPALRKILLSWKPDIVVTDPMVYPAVIACLLEKIPCVAVSNSLNPVLQPEIKSELLDTVAWLADDRQKLFTSFGLPEQKFSGCDWVSPLLTICFSTPSFIGREVAGVRQVGPSCTTPQRGDETPFPFEKLRPDRKKVLVSFGSQIYFQPERFNKILRALNAPDIQLVISASELTGSDLLKNPPPDAVIERYIPQMAVLPHMDAFITHGGANSVMEALYCGVPPVIAPICNDQFHQAWFIERAGCGVHLDLEQATDAQISAAVRACFENKNIKIIAKDYQANDGAEKSADLILRCAAC